MSDVVELAEVPELFERWLAGRPLAERSRREYARNVRAYCTWLAERPRNSALRQRTAGCDQRLDLTGSTHALAGRLSR